MEAVEQIIQSVEKVEKAKKSKEINTAIDIDTSIIKLLPEFDIHKARMWFYLKVTNSVDKISFANDDFVEIKLHQSNQWNQQNILLLVSLVKLIVGEYKSIDTATNFYSRYLELKAESNAAWQSQDMQQYSQMMNDLITLKIQLDVLWKQSWASVQLDDIWSNNDYSLKLPYKYWKLIESVYLGYLIHNDNHNEINSKYISTNVQQKVIVINLD